MDPAPRRTVRTDQLRPVNLPHPTRVTVDAVEGKPLTVRVGNRGVRVLCLRNEWRIDDRWWTDQPVQRHYFEVELANGQVITLFQDALTEEWYEQRYGAPRNG